MASWVFDDATGSADDIARYLWDGRVQRLGLDPHTAVPADPALTGLHTRETRGLNNPGVPSPYPAGAQLFFRAVTTIHSRHLHSKLHLSAVNFWTLSVLSTSLVWYLRPLRYPWRVPGWVLLLEYASVATSVALLCAWFGARNLRRGRGRLERQQRTVVIT